MGKILIIDDDEASRMILIERLENDVNTCIECKSGDEALSLLKQWAYTIDLVFLDIRLPDIDGWELLKQIKHLNAKIPVIAISAIVLLEDMDKYKEAGFDGNISKPFRPNEIQKIVYRFLKK